MLESSEPKLRVVGVDIGYEHTTYAIVDIRGNIIAQDGFLTVDYPDINDYVSELTDRIFKMIEENGGYETIRSIGLSSPSANNLTGCIENAANMPWKGVVPIAAMLQDRMALGVGLGNDAHVSALGEKTFGSAHGMENFIIVNLGYGLGSSFFSCGIKHEGHFGMAGEFGHTCVVDHGRKCSCGREGCLEAYVSTRGIIQTAYELMEESDEPSLMRGVVDLSPEKIREYCEQGDKLAIETFRRTGYLLGLGLSNYSALVNPEAIILTGGIPKSGKWLLEPMNDSFESHLFQNLRGKIKIMVSRLDNRTRDVLGASVIAWGVPEYSLFK